MRKLSLVSAACTLASICLSANAMAFGTLSFTTSDEPDPTPPVSQACTDAKIALDAAQDIYDKAKKAYADAVAAGGTGGAAMNVVRTKHIMDAPKESLDKAKENYDKACGTTSTGFHILGG